MTGPQDQPSRIPEPARLPSLWDHLEPQAPPGPYGQPVPQPWADPTKRTAAPPRRRKGWAIAAASVLVVVPGVAGVAVVAASDDEEPPTATEAFGDDGDIAFFTPGSADAAGEPDAVALPLGTAATVTERLREGETALSIEVTPSSALRVVEVGGFGDPHPTGGSYLLVDVVLTSPVGPLDVSARDFTLTLFGGVLAQEASSDAGWFDLFPDEVREGAQTATLVFDVPPGTEAFLGYGGFEGPVATWTLTHEGADPVEPEALEGFAG